MRKADIINKIAEKTGLQKTDVLISVETFLKEVMGSMKDGNNVYIRGFGSFVVKKRAQKIGRIITRNEQIVIPEHYVPTFRPAKSFVDRVKKSAAKRTTA